MSRPAEFAAHPWSYSKSPPTYRAVCKRVKDGDTFEMFADYGMRKYGYEEVRLRNFDTPEIFHPRNAAEKEHGLQAAEFVRGLIEGRPVTLTTYTDAQTYGRFVADVKFYDATAKVWRQLAAALAAAGFAKRASYE